MDALALASEEARHVHELGTSSLASASAGGAQRQRAARGAAASSSSGGATRRRSRGLDPGSNDPRAKRQRTAGGSVPSEQLRLALEWLEGTRSSSNALRQSLPPAYAVTLIRDDSFNPGPRPLHFDPLQLQKAHSHWVFKEWTGQHNRRTGASDSAAQQVDRWHNSGGSKNSRDLPTNVDRPLVKRRYGTYSSWHACMLTLFSSPAFPRLLCPPLREVFAEHGCGVGCCDLTQGLSSSTLARSTVATRSIVGSHTTSTLR
jgi:hypothetical protein